MPQAVIAVIAKVFVAIGVKAATAAIIATAVFNAAVSIAISAVAKVLSPKPKGSTPDRSSQLQRRIDPDGPRQIALGRVASAGTFVDAINYGSKGFQYVEVRSLADHECDGAESLIVDGVAVSWDQGTGAVGGYFFKGAQRLKVFFDPGTWAGGIRSEVITAFGGLYTSNDVGRGVAKLTIVADFEEADAFPTRDLPSIVCVFRGAKLYDRRLDSTQGGSGSHRLGTYSTYAWSNNVGVLLHNVATGIYLYGTGYTEWLGGGRYGIASLPAANWIAGINSCAESVTLNAGGSETRYTGGLLFNVTDDPETLFTDLLAACEGKLVDGGADLKFYPGVSQTAVATITDNDFKRGASRVRRPAAKARNRINAVYGTYTSPADNWKRKGAPRRRSSTDVTTDGGEDRDLGLELSVVQSGTQWQRIAEIRRRQSRRDDTHYRTLPSRLVGLEAGDWVTWQSDRFGWTKTFMLLPVQLKTGRKDMLSTELVLTEVNSADYAWNPATDEIADNSTRDLTAAVPPAATIPGFAVTAQTRTVSGQSVPDIVATWTDVLDPTIVGVRVEYRRVGDTPLLYQEGAASLNRLVITGGLLGGQTYECRAVAITDPVRTVTPTSYANVTVGSVPIVTPPTSNLIFNPTFALEAAGWNNLPGTTGKWGPNSAASNGGWAIIYGPLTTISEQFTIAARIPQIAAGNAYSFQVQVALSGRTAGQVRTYVQWLDASLNSLGFIVLTQSTDTGLTTLSADNQVAPTGTTQVLVYGDTLGLSLNSGGFAVLARFKFELSTVATNYTDEATVGDTGRVLDVVVDTTGTPRVADNKVVTSSVETNGITKGAIARTTGSVSLGIGTWTQIQTVTMTTAGGDVRIDSSFVLTASGSGSGDNEVSFRIKRDGTVIYTAPIDSLAANQDLTLYNSGVPVSGNYVTFVQSVERVYSQFTVDPAPSAASHTYTVEAFAAYNGSATERSLALLETKR